MSPSPGDGVGSAGRDGAYREAGVDLEGARRLVSSIGPAVTATWGPDVVGTFGGFAAGVRLPPGYDHPVLMLTTDGVGTKAEIARAARRYSGLGFDLVAMCVDDLVATGARPLALVDYLAVGRLDEARDQALVESVAAACRLAACALLGGEIAEHPGVMEADRFDLAGTALGVVEEGKQVDGRDIRAGDVLVGVASPNLRANGFSLVRRVLSDRLDPHRLLPGTDRTVVDVLLEPSVIYAPAVLAALDDLPVHGLAHITGGGLPGNLSRILPTGGRAVIDRSTWRPPPVFETIAELGEIPDEEMFRTFNMGVGFVAVLPPDRAQPLMTVLEGYGHQAWTMGEVRDGEAGVEIAGTRVG